MTRLIPAADNIWYTEMRLQALDLGVRGALIVGAQHAIVFDTFTRPQDMLPVAEAAQGKPITVVYSHADWDHFWGTAALHPANVAAQADALRRFEDPQDVPGFLDKLRQEYPGIFEDVRLVKPDLTFDRRLDIDCGGVTLELHSLPGHTPDSLVGFIPQAGILLGGDCIEDPFPVVNRADLLPGWIAALEAWAARPDVKTAAPAHGSISDRSLLHSNIAYLKGLYDGSSPLPDQMDAFYRETHANNLRLVKKEG